ncbi:MAG: hypothetical protein WCD21_22715 [Streptomyces sp.]
MAVDASDGIGTIASCWTGVPLLFIEVDNCHESAEEIADELHKYARFFRRKVKDTDGREQPMWRTRWSWSAPEGPA